MWLLLSLASLFYYLYGKYTEAPPPNGAKERVVIIGASSGIGKALALLYASRGAHLLLVARREAQLAQVRDACLAKGATRCEIAPADITLTSDMQRAAQLSKTTLGGCDTLVINAGVISVLPFREQMKQVREDQDQGKSSVIDKIFTTNVYGPLYCLDAFMDLLVETSGRIVVVSSMAAVMASPTRALYAGTKAALNAFFNSLRLELASTGVSVTVCMPGSVLTDLRSAAVDAAPSPDASSSSHGSRKGAITPEKAAEYIMSASDRRARDVMLPTFYRWLYWVSVFVPEITDALVKMKYKQ